MGDNKKGKKEKFSSLQIKLQREWFLSTQKVIFLLTINTQNDQLVLQKEGFLLEIIIHGRFLKFKQFAFNI